MDKNKLWKWMLLGILILWSLTLIYPPTDKYNMTFVVDDSGGIVNVKDAEGKLIGVKDEDGKLLGINDENGELIKTENIKPTIIRAGKIRLGLDLKGGSSFIVQVDEADVRKKMAEANEIPIDEVNDSDVKKRIADVQKIAVETIRNRIDALGTAEPEIYPEGDNRIVVRLPGIDVETREDARNQIISDAVLTFKLVHNNSAEWVSELYESQLAPAGFKWASNNKYGRVYIRDGSSIEKISREQRERMKRLGNKGADFMLIKKDADDGSTIYQPEYIEFRPQMGGENIKNAQVDRDPTTGSIQIVLSFDKKGKEDFGQVTSKYAPGGKANSDSREGRRLAVILDDTLYSAPSIREAIFGGNATISGSFTLKEATRLANALEAGSLPGRVQIIEERSVAPTLGQAAVNSGLRAIIYGGLAVLIFMGLYYMVPGLVANVSLFFVLFLLPVGMVISSGFLGVLSGTLEGGAVSLPVLTLYGIAGIVLTVGMAVDANVLIFERMREEWSVGKSISGAINAGYGKAFSTILDANVTTLLTAIILFWQGSGPIRGFAVTLSAGIIISMIIVLIITRLFFNSMADANMLKSLKMASIPGLAKASFDFVGKRKIAAILSIALIVASWGVFVSKGDKNLGVDFKGGMVMTCEFEEKQEQVVVEDKLAQAGFPNAVVAYLGIDGGKEILEIKVGANDEVDVAKIVLTTIKELEGNYEVLNTDKVGSQIGNELKARSIKAIIFALIGIIIYISIRFEFSFAMGAIVALAHDVLITVGVYCLLGRELSMPIIAALLTIVGYSVNDTIVVFDRIREDLKLHHGKSYKDIANMSINQTLSRTLLTSITTLLTVVMLLVFGGGAVNDFALALFIGILVGTYSSIFVATPVVLFWHKEEKVK